MAKIINIIFKYEAKSFLRSRFQILILCVTFILGAYSTYNGNDEIKTQKNAIETVKKIEQNEFHQYEASFQQELVSLQDKQQQEIASDPSYAWHRHGFHAVLPPSDLAPLALGQRDLSPYYYRLTGMSLYYQLFQNEIANPLNLLVGSFDLSFVITYLFPLLIIAFTYGLLSRERERGILPLLKIQSISIRKILLIRLLFYFISLVSLSFAISILGFIVSGVSLSSSNVGDMAAWLITVLFYLSFWFSLLLFIISLNKSSPFNAITAAGCWLLFLIVIPAVLNMITTLNYPDDSTELAGVVRRQGLENEENEEELTKVIDEYLKHHPELHSNDSSFQSKLLAKAYASFSQLNDLKHKKIVDAYTDNVLLRDDLANSFNLINPAVNTQNIFTQIAETNLSTYLNFQKSLETFHQEIIRFYYPKLFKNQPIRQADYKQLPVYEMKVNQNWSSIYFNLLQLLLAGSIFFIIGFILIGRKII